MLPLLYMIPGLLSIQFYRFVDIAQFASASSGQIDRQKPTVLFGIFIFVVFLCFFVDKDRKMVYNGNNPKTGN